MNVASKLFPTILSPKDQLNALFDAVYDARKSFKKHVNNRVNGCISPSLQLFSCREVKKHYTGWQFLKALDCSTQSLNQVRFFMLGPYFSESHL